MANFKITVETLSPDVTVAEKLRNGLECDGFFLGGLIETSKTTDVYTVSIYGLNTLNLATGITKSTDLLEAAIIARGMEEAHQMRAKRENAKAPNLLAALLEHAAEDD